METFFAAIKGITEKIQKKIQNIFIWEETLFISLSFKKKIGILGTLF